MLKNVKVTSFKGTAKILRVVKTTNGVETREKVDNELLTDSRISKKL